jgi:hypothetical protein
VSPFLGDTRNSKKWSDIPLINYFTRLRGKVRRYHTCTARGQRLHRVGKATGTPRRPVVGRFRVACYVANKECQFGARQVSASKTPGSGNEGIGAGQE